MGQWRSSSFSLFLIFHPAVSGQESRKHEGQIAISHLSFHSSSPSAQAREREKVKEDPSAPFSPTTSIPGSHT